jgi:hypothetical protein
LKRDPGQQYENVGWHSNEAERYRGRFFSATVERAASLHFWLTACRADYSNRFPWQFVLGEQRTF